ncbi:hypothetical protein ANO14919_092610 [Xylariales sp. No.14919]|nr:hypothetical protein ANO14919_092610 [Xylariales sp. No.14919]
MATTRDILEGRLVIAHNGLLEAEEPHEHHGHPPLADPGTEFWMKWDEWNLDLMEMNQYNQIEQFETVVKPGLEWFSENSKRMRLGKLSKPSTWRNALTLMLLSFVRYTYNIIP